MEKTQLNNTFVIVEELVHRVGAYLCQGVQQQKEIQFKGQVDLVTQYDRVSQQMIVDELMKNSKTQKLIYFFAISLCSSAIVRLLTSAWRF